MHTNQAYRFACFRCSTPGGDGDGGGGSGQVTFEWSQKRSSRLFKI